MRPWVLNHSVQFIENGGILAYPIEAVYGLGYNPFCSEAVRTILRLKMRSVSKGLIVVGADISQFWDLIDLGWLQRREDILASWPANGDKAQYCCQGIGSSSGTTIMPVSRSPRLYQRESWRLFSGQGCRPGQGVFW